MIAGLQVGRVVHYHPDISDSEQIDLLQPFLAHVIFLHPIAGVVNLVGWNHHGDRFVKLAVRMGKLPGQWSWPSVA